jgi:hypothetical protein
MGKHDLVRSEGRPHTHSLGPGRRGDRGDLQTDYREGHAVKDAVLNSPKKQSSGNRRRRRRARLDEVSLDEVERIVIR